MLGVVLRSGFAEGGLGRGRDLREAVQMVEQANWIPAFNVQYKVGIDDTVSYSGHRSLKMQFVGDGATQK